MSRKGFKKPDLFMTLLVLGIGFAFVLFVIGFPELGWITGR